jgi:hypothetical protein
MKKEKNEFEIQSRPKLNELIKFKESIKLLESLINIFKDLIEEMI